jgi:hypothetical protein
MRLWTLHPQYLDARGLVALWREALLAQKVLQGATGGYRHHPQLARFRAQPAPLAAIGTYLVAVAAEADRRGYRFDARKIGAGRVTEPIAETDGQLCYEWYHLRQKLQQRQPALYQLWQDVATPAPHPLFTIVQGAVRDWERQAQP